jgi:phage antirepressor YoqD-like protein
MKKPKITQITQQELFQLYSENSNKKVCEILQITNPTLIRYLKENKIALKGRGNRNKKGKLDVS